MVKSDGSCVLLFLDLGYFMHHSASAQRYLIINTSCDTHKDMLARTCQKSLCIGAQHALLNFIHMVATGPGLWRHSDLHTYLQQ